MPFLCPPLLRRLLELAPCGEIVVPRWRGEYEPLHAVYARSCLGAVEAVLRAGGRRVTETYSAVRVHVVGEAEVAQFDPGGLSFHNLNTPEDVARAEELLRAGEAPS
jgi:molybdopterin-guanine dinucleotide biosynthesis protein A